MNESAMAPMKADTSKRMAWSRCFVKAITEVTPATQAHSIAKIPREINVI